jgi:Ca2+:H+ antiporter
MLATLRRELQVPVGWISVGLLLLLGERIVAAGPILEFVLFAILFPIILWGAFTVVRHAEEIAHRLGEPYGTLVLTMAVTVIEVSFIIVVMMDGPDKNTLARDTVFAVLMITLNGVAGLCILLGGLRHSQQVYNLEGARAFLAVIMPVSMIALVLPNFTTSTAGPTLSSLQAGVFAVLILLLYIVFLGIQTIRHAGFFRDPAANEPGGDAEFDEEPEFAEHETRAAAARSTGYHVLLLLLAILPVIVLTEQLAHIVQDGIRAAGAPMALGGVVVAILVLSPESMGALKAAVANRLQRSVNIALGSALATIGLTIPSVLAASLYLGIHVTLGLPGEETMLLILTLITCMLTFGGGRTNVLQGAVHLVLFAVYVLLLFDP